MFKISKLIATSIFTTLLAFPLALKAEEFSLIGVNHPPLPETVEAMYGWLIEDSHSIDRVSMRGQELLLLSRLTGRNSQGDPSFEVVSMLSLPLMYKTETIKGSESFCSVNEKIDPNIVVLVKIENTPKLTKARKAWRIENEEFKEISVQGLSFACENFGYGL